MNSVLGLQRVSPLSIEFNLGPLRLLLRLGCLLRHLTGEKSTLRRPLRRPEADRVTGEVGGIKQSILEGIGSLHIGHVAL